jgi:hypothetical protein
LRIRICTSSELPALIPQKQSVDLPGVEIDVAARHAACHEVLLPSVNHLRNGLRLFESLH